MKTINQYKKELHEMTNSFDFNPKNPFEVTKYISLITNFIGKEYLQAYVMNLKTKDILFTRARKNISNGKCFTNVKELWYPETKFIKDHERANFRYKQVFYCSDVAGTSLFEVKPEKEGEWITILDLGIEKENLRLLTFALNEKYPTTNPTNFSDKEIALNQFITDKFTEEIPCYKSYLYLPTAIITNLLITDFDGVIFPSVASKLNGDNIALRTHIVDNFSILREARVFEITKFNSNIDFKIECKFISKEIKSNGKIIWEEVSCNGHEIDENLYHQNI